ncbi:MAG TPA: YceI family protein [Symbiobacteriaceae bacterium]|jgi:polyisoprenoid-binding protein YceI|nr:YceI family protein [Symbiobacteriaceae bacterium]
MAKEKWVLDPAHSVLEFSVRHMMVKAKGRFTKPEGVVLADVNDLTTAEFEVSVDAATIDTNEAQRDGHLRSADFFDVENFPKLTFKSWRIERKGDSEYELVGDLTIHGITKSTVWTLTFEGAGKNPWGQEIAGFSAETKVNRKEFGLVWNAALETGGFLLGDEVKIAVQIEAVKQA